MPKSSYRDVFVKKLTKMSGGGKKLIGNISLRTELGWSAERYASIKEQLVEEKVILLARGKGGSVGLAETESIAPTKLFISYCHVDSELERELVKHLTPLKRVNQIEIWDDKELQPGDKWNEEIAQRLARADVVVLLVSVDFLNSYYCYDKELQNALERQARGEVKVIPIILRACMWKNSPFAKLQVLPQYGNAITAFPDKDSAFSQVAEALREVVLEMREEK
jgi:TIR domain